MKKLFGLILTLIYIFTANTLVHASTMGFFDMPYGDPACHADAPSPSHHQTQQTMHCCTVFFVSHYAEVKITMHHIDHFVQNNDVWIHHGYDKNNALQKPSNYSIAFSPGGQTSLNVYNKFSDLFGVVVKII